MGYLVAQGQGALERAAAKVQVTVFGTEVLTAVALFLDGEGRRYALVEDGDGFQFDFDVSGGHLGVLGAAFHHFAGCLDHVFTAQGGGGLHQGGGGIGLYHQLGDAIAVTQVDECHAAQFTGLLHPSCQRYLLAFVLNAEFPASVCSVHM